MSLPTTDKIKPVYLYNNYVSINIGINKKL